jgi:glycerophosphoryl diester phosphodiesterase
MLVDEWSERTEHRLYCIYGLDSARVPQQFEGRFFGDVYDLGRYRGHYYAARGATPGVIAEVAFGPDDLEVPETEPGTFGAGRLVVAACPSSGYVLIVEVVTCASLEELPNVTAATCFHREDVRLRGETLLAAVTSAGAAIGAARSLTLGRDVHQLWLLSDQAAVAVVQDDPDALDPAFDLENLLAIVYRSRSPQRSGRHSLRFPNELNRATGSLACHARGVTVAARQARHTEHAMALTATQLVASLGRLRQIRRGTAEALRTLRDPRLHALSLDAQRRQFAELAADATGLEVDLSFGVEANLDSVLVPEIVLESYRDSLATAMGLPNGLEATSHMLSRLAGALRSTEQKIVSEAKERDETRSARISAAVAYATVVALPIGLFFAYFAIPDRAKTRTSLLDFHRYWGIYLLLAVLLFLGSGAVYGLTVARQWRRRRRQGSVMRQVRISAHRVGAGDTLPTLEAFRLAAESGVELVEFDVRRTRDGVLVVSHDPRTGSGARIEDVDAATWAAAAPGEVVRMKDVLPLLRNRAIAHVDLKERGYEADVVKLCIAELGVDGFVITSLEDDSIARIKEDYPEVKAALSLGRDLDGKSLGEKLRVRFSELFPERRLRECRADAVAVHYRLAGLRVRRACARLGMPIMVWTVNKPSAISKLLRCEDVDVVITDRPADAMRLRQAVPAQRAGAGEPERATV